MTPSLPRIDQLLAGFAEGDATSQDALGLQQVLRQLGHPSDIFVAPGRISPTMTNLCLPMDQYAGAAPDSLIYHYGGQSPATACFIATPARRLVRYHNITPGDFFDGYDDTLAASLRAARLELPGVLAAAIATLAASEYNATEARQAGAGQVCVLPLVPCPARHPATPDPATLKRYSGPLTNLLFVGRIAPNKRIEDLILAFEIFQQRFNPLSRLILVGSERSCPRYYTALRRLAAERLLTHVCFEGYTLETGLEACYRASHAFVCASAHEGYCLPLIEAMAHGLPVIARKAGGTPEAMDGAGVLYSGLDPSELATLIHRTLTDPALRTTVIASQQTRVDRWARRHPATEVQSLLATLR
jgi:glycosyltransferase involved in cell wall biosynthesis